MAEFEESPYRCHVFVCTNDRKGERKSCGDGGVGPEVRAALKELVAERGWKGRVRVSQCGCLGLCQRGPNVMLYPQRRWFSAVAAEDVEVIAAAIEAAIEEG